MDTVNELTLTDANFETATSKGVVLVNFWAPWCGPCLRQAPFIEKVAATMSGLVKVGKCDIDKELGTPARFDIKGIPTLVILKNGKEVERFTGVQRDDLLIATLKKHLEP